uniref:Uncharacterized protein n=1 Tax=Molossus molossus TaxID=27622 RepID=A0A7J8DU30_MOLMO|nr:hypothetical protein HJG59_009179 [Molossus molossus]
MSPCCRHQNPLQLVKQKGICTELPRGLGNHTWMPRRPGQPSQEVAQTHHGLFPWKPCCCHHCVPPTSFLPELRLLRKNRTLAWGRLMAPKCHQVVRGCSGPSGFWEVWGKEFELPDAIGEPTGGRLQGPRGI